MRVSWGSNPAGARRALDTLPPPCPAAPCGWGGCCSSWGRGSRPCWSRRCCSTRSSACGGAGVLGEWWVAAAVTIRGSPAGGARPALLRRQPPQQTRPTGLQARQAHNGGPHPHLRDMAISTATEGSPVAGSRESYLGAGSVAMKGSVGLNRLVCIATSSPRSMACWPALQSARGGEAAAAVGGRRGRGTSGGAGRAARSTLPPLRQPQAAAVAGLAPVPRNVGWCLAASPAPATK